MKGAHAQGMGAALGTLPAPRCASPSPFAAYATTHGIPAGWWVLRLAYMPLCGLRSMAHRYGARGHPEYLWRAAWAATNGNR